MVRIWRAGGEPTGFVRADGLAERERGGELVLVVELVPCEYSQCPM